MTTRSNSDSPTLPARARRRDTAVGEQLAQLQLDIARLFLAYGKTAVARRRLRRIAEQCGDSPTGVECRTLLAALEPQPEPAATDHGPVNRLASA